MIDYKVACTKVLDAVRAIVLSEGVDANQGETVERAMVKLLGLAWCESVRAEFQVFVDMDPELKAQHAVALELMREDRYDNDPICMQPGMKAWIVKVDNQEAVAVDYCLAQVMPLSAIYVNRVRIVQSAAARVSKALMEEAAKAPAEWPIKIASGETFNSIEEMEASPIDAVRKAAVMMRDSEHYRSGPMSVPIPFKAPDPPTCWQYFGLDGPTNFHNLNLMYQEKIMSVGLDNDKVAETHNQYHKCLKEIGAAIMDGGSSERTS